MMPTVNIFIDKILKEDFETPKILTANIFRKLPLGCPPAIEFCETTLKWHFLI